MRYDMTTNLQEYVLGRVRRFPVEKRSALSAYELPPKPLRRRDHGSMVERIWHCLTQEPVCMSPKQVRRTAFARHHRLLAKRVASGAIIDVGLIAIPFKNTFNPLVTIRKGVDLGEMSFFHLLAAISREVGKIYPPGLRWHILTESRALARVFGCDENAGTEYLEGCQRIVQDLGDGFLEFHDLQAVLESNGPLWAIYEDLCDEAVKAPTVTETWRVSPQALLPTFTWSVPVGDLLLRDAKPYFEATPGETIRLASLGSDLCRTIYQRALSYAAFLQATMAVAGGESLLPALFPGWVHVGITRSSARLTVRMSWHRSSRFPHHGVPLWGKNRPVQVVRLKEVLMKRQRVKALCVSGDHQPVGFQVSDA